MTRSSAASSEGGATKHGRSNGALTLVSYSSSDSSSDHDAAPAVPLSGRERPVSFFFIIPLFSN